MVNVSEQVLKWTQTDNRHASKNARNCLVQWLFSCQFRKRGDKYDTCAINKIRIWVDVFGERRREEMEINDHVYSTTHFLPKQLQNSRKSRSGKIFWDRIFQSGSKTRLWLHASMWWSICSALNSRKSQSRPSSFPPEVEFSFGPLG